MLPKSLTVVLVVAALSLAGCSKDPEVAKREFVRSGDAYVAGKKLHEAVVEYRNAIKQDGRFAEARVKLAEVYLQLGDFGNAYHESVRAADLLPNDPEAQVKVGEMLLVAGSFEDAKARADKALARQPNHIQAQILRANALAGLNKIDDAIAEVEQAIRNDPDRSASYASLGLIQMIRGDRVQAETAFKKALDTNPQSVPAHLALANFYTTIGRHEDAERLFKAAVTFDPKDLLSNRALGYFYIASGRAEQAEAHLKIVAEGVPNPSGKLILADYYIGMRRLIDARRILDEVASTDNEGFAAAKLRLASLGLSSGDRAGAAHLVDEVLAKHPAHADALIVKADLLAGAGKLDEALATARSATAAHPRSAQAQFAVGRVHILRRDEGEATTALNQALQLDPRLAQAELELAKIDLARGRINEAEQLAQSAIKKIGGYAEAHLLLARVHLLKGEPDKAQASLKALVAAFPDSPAVQTEVGLLELSRQNRPAARAAFERALSNHSTYIEALAGLIRLDIDEKRPEAAKARATEALRLNAKDAAVLILASRTYATLGDAVAAERFLQQAIAADPKNLDGYGMLGRLYASQQRLGEATTQFERLAERQPKSVSTHTIVGILLDMQNRTSDARARYEQVLQIDSRAAVAANNLAWIYAESGGNLDMALQLAQTAMSQLPDRPEVTDTLGWIYHKKGLSSMALTPLLQSVQKDPRNATYHYHLGMAYAGTGDKERARAALTKALSLDGNFAGAAEARQTLAGLKS